MYYDIDGNPVSDEWFMENFRKDPAYWQIGSDTVRDLAFREHHVSTVWLGLNHGYGDSIVIFETMIFCHDHDCECDEYQVRYATKERALEGHQRAVDMVKSRPSTRVRWKLLFRLLWQRSKRFFWKRGT